MKKYYFIFIYIVIIGLIAIIIGTRDQWLSGQKTNIIRTNKISSFKECANLGYPIQKTYPRRCVSPQGQIFIEEISKSPTSVISPNSNQNEKIHVTSPQENESIGSPITIKGEARGNWYFEASFPIALYDSNDILLAEAPAQAKGEWMTEDFVPFELTLSFPKPTTTSGKIVLKKDNPSGLPENDEQIEIPVLFFASGVGR